MIDVETDKQAEEFDKYLQILDDYERDLDLLKKMQSSLEKDIFDDAHAAQDIRNFEAREARMEKMLGSKFLTRVSADEAGSTISAINKKQHQKLVMDDFLQKVENYVRS